MMANQNGSGPGSSSDPPTVQKRCTICNVPFINPDLINVHYRHHMTPKLCLVVSSDEDGGSHKYIELTQQQALAYSAGVLPIIQNTVGGQQQYILADQSGSFKTTTFDGGSQQLITTAYAQPTVTNSLGTEVEMVHYVDSSGHELTQEEVQYYALDGQEYSVIQANEEIVVSTEGRLSHEDQPQQLVIEESPQSVMTSHLNKSKGRGTKRKNSTSGSEVSKTFSRRGQPQPRVTTVTSPKKIILSNEQPPSYSVAAASKVQTLSQGHSIQGQIPVSSISFVTSGGQTHHVTTANHHLDLHHVTSDQFLSTSSLGNEEIVVSHLPSSKLKTDPELITSDTRDPNHDIGSIEAGTSGSTFHSTSDLKPLGLKVDTGLSQGQQLLQHQDQQYIVLAYDNDGGIHQLQHTTKGNVEGFDIKEEKVTV